MPHKKEKSIPLLLAGLILLAACSAPRAETPIPTPSPTPEVTPAPTPEPTLTLEPTEEVKELWGFPIDDTHDAFEVPTGGKLGTVLVTVEIGEEEFYFSVWTADNLEEPIQRMTAEGPERFYGHELMDANFDGYMDFCYTYAVATVNARYEVWAWNESLGQFVGTGQLTGYLLVDEETQTISSYIRGGWAGALGSDTFYRWENVQLVCIRRVSTVPPEEGNDSVMLVVEDRTDGELTEVFRKEYPLSGGGAFQEAEKWKDLSYHGS